MSCVTYALLPSRFLNLTLFIKHLMATEIKEFVRNFTDYFTFENIYGLRI